MTIWISQEHPLCNFERLDVLCARIGHLCEKLWPFEFLESFCCSISSASIRTHLNRTTMWKDMTIRLTRELPMFNFKHLDELCPRIGHLCEKLWPFKYLECFRCAISSVSMSYVRESDIFAKRYDHLNFSSASIVQLRASRYIMSQNRTSVWKFMTIRISRVLPLCNFKRLDELCPKFGHPCETLWPFEFL